MAKQASKPAKKAKKTSKKVVSRKAARRDAKSAFAAGLASELKARLKRSKASPDDLGILSDGVGLSEVTEWIPTGFLPLDAILGGGWPVGRAVEVFGAEGKGKSALAHMAIKSVQAAGGTAMLLDFEAALDTNKLTQLGIDTSRLIYYQPDYVEQAWGVIWSTVDYLHASKPDAPFLIVWDSVAASPPKAELEDETGEKSRVGLLAKAMARGCRQLFKAIAKVRACMMWVNQIRDKIGAFGFGPQVETPGGRALKFAASIRLWIAYTKRIKGGEDEVSGYEVHVVTNKNRLAKPHRKTYWVLDFEEGPSPELTLLAHLIDARLVVSSGGGYYTAKYGPDFGKFRKRDFVERCKTEAAFRKAAEAALIPTLTA